MVVLLIGLIGVMALFGHTIIALGFAQQNLIAKQKAREAMESIFTARNTAQVSFDQIRNVSDGGVFLDGLQPLNDPGPDGLVGTSDDGSIETMRLAGKDGLLGTPDDEARPLTGFRRQIQLSSISAEMRQITITLRYSGKQGFTRNYQVVSYISPYR